MADREIRQPGHDHPITIRPNPARILVTIAGKVLADTSSALTLTEASYPPVQYIPLSDVDASLLQASDHTTYCPYKGECSYYSIPAGGDDSVNAVWSYATPYPAVAEIADHVAFYPKGVESITEAGA